MTTKQIETAYRRACERYAEHGVKVEAAVRKLATVSISMHCWQATAHCPFCSACATDIELANKNCHSFRR